MQVWRICRRPFADLTGEGARLYGGRWNSPGRPMIYAAETAALAVLEVRVHLDLDWDVLPSDYVLVAINLPEIQIEELTALPEDTVEVGDAWLASRRSALLKVPSAIVAESFNMLINCTHPDAATISTASIRPFVFDERLWRPRRPS
jgi:RES domain-containing protein